MFHVVWKLHNFSKSKWKIKKNYFFGGEIRGCGNEHLVPWRTLNLRIDLRLGSSCVLVVFISVRMLRTPVFVHLLFCCKVPERERKRAVEKHVSSVCSHLPRCVRALRVPCAFQSLA